MLINSNINSNTDPITPFLIQPRNTPISPYFGIFSYPSSIGLLKGFTITNDTRRVGLNTSSPSYEFTITNNLNSSNGYFSSIHAFGAIQSDSLVSPSLYINAAPYLSINTLSSSARKLFMNNDLMTLVNSARPRMGIKQTNPGGNVTEATLDITGSAYFSTVELRTHLVSNTLRLGSVLL
jgi:hypothetical protein